MSSARQNAINAVTNYRSPETPMDFSRTPAQEIFGANVFGEQVMRERLPKAVFKALQRTLTMGEKLEVRLADAVAVAMRDWAIEKGATHYAHVFYPLTGMTAEKHDSFLEPNGQGGVLAEFSARQLIQGEPDASSFPSGGLRATFEARGYTAWDVTSPAYIMENANGTTLCIPTVFCSWTGDALDKKTPLLRSVQALDIQGRRILKLFGNPEPGRVAPTAGAEQEYFLIDRHFFFARPDLINAGRTLFGTRPPKGQELEDQYFGAIPNRVLSCMLETERELYKLGVPIKTRHNEVAPAQYEVAPMYESANVATDHQYMTMTVLQRVAGKYGMTCLMHEKPFAGINGSGKHLNWSLSHHGNNLLEPGDTPHDNAQFLVFCAAIIRGVHRHANLLRAVVAQAGNDHRLGANEAPPVIISIYLGEPLTDIFEQIAQGGIRKKADAGDLNVGVDTLPPLPKDVSDRNRTSPLAFTGNKFEFRAVGSSQSIAGPLVALNTIAADSLDYIAGRLEELSDGDPDKLNQAAQHVIKEIFAEHGAVVFNGDNYSSEWQAEAKVRGLPNLRDTVDALPALVAPETLTLFEAQRVLSRREVKSRHETYLEQYIKDVQVESNLTLEIARTQLFPAVVCYQQRLADTTRSLSGLEIGHCTGTLERITKLAGDFQHAMDKLESLMAKDAPSSTYKHAVHIRDRILPAMHTVRRLADQLEAIVDDSLWPLPTYQEMLFIK